MSSSPQLDYILELLESNRNDIQAEGMAAYMKNHFPFYGIKSPLRKKLVSEYWSACKGPADDSFKALIRSLWDQPNREAQYFAMDLIQKLMKKMDASWIELMEELIIKKSWWDSVDFLAANPVGIILKDNPELIKKKTQQWMKSDNMWLQRSCLLFQLKYKDQVDFDMLARFINDLKGSKEFFINKAIGWSLRQYSKFNPDKVRHFIGENPDLHPLSIREGSKYI